MPPKSPKLISSISLDDFLNRFRSNLPEKYRMLNDEDLFRLAIKAKPELANTVFSGQQRQGDDIGYGDIFKGSVKSFLLNLPSQFVSQSSLIAGFIEEFAKRAAPDDEKVQKESRELARAQAELGQLAYNFSRSYLKDDTQYQAYLKWLGDNPFSFSKVLTNKKLLFNEFLNSIFSMAPVVVSGILTRGLGPISEASMVATGFFMESGDIHRQRWQEAIDAGIPIEEIEKTAREGVMLYAPLASIMEVVVPRGVTRSLGLGPKVARKTISRFGTKYMESKLLKGLASREAAQVAWRELIDENVSLASRLVTAGKIFGISALEETGTEYFQALSEELILKDVAGQDITPDMILQEATNIDVLRQAFGGLLGGGAFGAIRGVTEGAGVPGRDAAKQVYDLYKEFEPLIPSDMPEQQRESEKARLLDTFAKMYMESDDVSGQQRIEFAKELARLTGVEAVESISREIKEEPAERGPGIKERIKQLIPKKGKEKQGEEFIPADQIQEGEPQPTQKEPEVPVLKRIVNPKLGRAPEVEGGTSSEKALNFVLTVPEKELISQLESLEPDERKTFTNLVASAIFNMMPEGSIKREDLYKESGEPDPKKVTKVLTLLRSKGARITREGLELLEGPEGVPRITVEELTGVKGAKSLEEAIYSGIQPDITGVEPTPEELAGVGGEEMVGEPTKGVQNRKPIEKALERLREKFGSENFGDKTLSLPRGAKFINELSESQLIDLANEVVRLEKQSNYSKLSDKEKKAIEHIKDNLAANGYEIRGQELIGERYDYRHEADVTFKGFLTGGRDKKTDIYEAIIRVDKPEIRKDGKKISNAQIIVGQFESKEAAEQYLKYQQKGGLQVGAKESVVSETGEPEAKKGVPKFQVELAQQSNKVRNLIPEDRKDLRKAIDDLTFNAINTAKKTKNVSVARKFQSNLSNIEKLLSNPETREQGINELEKLSGVTEKAPTSPTVSEKAPTSQPGAPRIEVNSPVTINIGRNKVNGTVKGIQGNKVQILTSTGKTVVRDISKVQPIVEAKETAKEATSKTPVTFNAVQELGGKEALILVDTPKGQTEAYDPSKHTFASKQEELKSKKATKGFKVLYASEFITREEAAKERPKTPTLKDQLEGIEKTRDKHRNKSVKQLEKEIKVLQKKVDRLKVAKKFDEALKIADEIQGRREVISEKKATENRPPVKSKEVAEEPKPTKKPEVSKKAKTEKKKSEEMPDMLSPDDLDSFYMGEEEIPVNYYSLSRQDIIDSVEMKGLNKYIPTKEAPEGDDMLPRYGGVNAKDVLKKIIKNSKSKAHKRIAKFLLKNSKDLPPVFWDVDGVFTGGSVRGVYRNKQHEIYIDPLKFRSVKQFERVVLHEIIHGVTSRWILLYENNMLTASSPVFSHIKALEGAYRYIKELYPDENDAPYAVTDLNEFVANFLFEQKAWKPLLEVKVDRKENLFQRIWRLILNIFTGGRKIQNTMLEQVMNDFMSLVKEVESPAPQMMTDILFDVLEKSNNYQLIARIEHSFDQANEEQQQPFDEAMESWYEHMITEKFNMDPGALLHNFFSKELGIYLKRDQIGRLVAAIKDLPEISFLDDNQFQEYKQKIIDIVNSFAGEKLENTENNPILDRNLKLWYQRIRSRYPVAYKFGDPGRIILEVELDRPRGTPRFKLLSRLNPFTKNTNPTFVVQNFLEEDNGKGYPTRLIFLSSKNAFLKYETTNEYGEVETRYRPVRPGELSLDGRQMYDLSIRMADDFANKKRNMALVFFAETSGDDSKIYWTVLKPKYMSWSLEDLSKFLDDEIAAGNMIKAHKDIVMKEIPILLKGGKGLPKNPYAIAQWLSMHDKWKAIKGDDYLMYEVSDGKLDPKKTIAISWKRFKADKAEGTMPRGVGNRKLFLVNSADIVIEAKNLDGEYVREDALMPDGTYKADGALFTSHNFINKINKVMGLRSYIYKTYIRHLDRSTNRDYINLKMLESTPTDGMRILDKKTGKLIAVYNDGKWITDYGEVDSIGTIDNEVKQARGRFNQTNTVLELPEESTRILQIHEGSKPGAVHPVVSHTLALSRNFMKVPEAHEYLNAVIQHYGKRINEYLTALFEFSRNKKAMRDAILRDILPGEIPDELQYALGIDRSGSLLNIYHFAKLALPAINRKFITNGLYKVRPFNRQDGTLLHIKPAFGLNLKPGEFVVAADSTITLKIAMREYERVTGEKLSLKDNSKKDIVKILNKFLEDNKLYLMLHRQPINGFAKNKPYRLKGFLLGKHGPSAFLAFDDVFRSLEGDFDGDEVFIEYIPDSPLIPALLKLTKTDAFKARNYPVLLELFRKGYAGKSIVSIIDTIKLLDENKRLFSIQGNVVNMRTALSVLAWKGFKAKISDGSVIVSYSPDDRVLMDYWPIDPDMLDQPFMEGKTVREVFEQYGAKFIEKDGKTYLETTKEHEFMLLLQAAVDNEKFNLYGHIKFADRNGNPLNLHQWLLTRVFRNEDGSTLTKKQVRVVDAVYDLFNFSPDRRGKNRETNRQATIYDNLNRSYNLYSVYFNPLTHEKYSLNEINKNIMNYINQTLRNRANSTSSAFYTNVKPDLLTSVETNGELVPDEYLITALAREHLKIKDKFPDTPHSVIPEMLPQGYYKAAHYVTMTQWSSELADEINSMSESELKQVAQGRKLGLELYKSFMSIFGRVEQERKSRMSKRRKNNSMVEQEASESVYDYNVAYEEFLAEYYPKWVKLSKLARRWATVSYLGSASGLLKLPPLQVVDGKTIVEYSQRYSNILYTPNFRGQYDTRGSALGPLTRTLANITKLYCG